MNSAISDGYKGMFWGLVVGDCLGSPIQFSGKDQHPYVTEMEPCAIFSTPPGYWTDDSSMAFCIAESFVRLERYDLADIANNFARWYWDGFYSSLPRSFDVGKATALACRSIRESGQLANGSEDSQGNGSIMRMAPAIIMNHGNPSLAMLHEISDLTHNSKAVRQVVERMAKVCHQHLAGEKTDLLSIYQSREQVNNSGWAVSTLEAALWAFHSTSDFAAGMLAAVNLGGDSDTIGAVYGQIAGAFYGYQDIPEKWLAKIKDRKKINQLIEALINLKLRL
jgi:ADP-ribosyl-[dinitrogen reductase] hydrolase